MGECKFFGNELRTDEFNKGYIGAINNPIKGKIKPSMGTSAKLVISVKASVPSFNCGKMPNKIPPEINTQMITKYTHDIRFVRYPAKNRPAAKDMAKIKAI